MFYWNGEGHSGGVGRCPEAQVGKFLGIWKLVPSDLQVFNRWLPFWLVLGDRLGKVSSRTKDFPPPIWMSKGLVFRRILLGKWKRPRRVVFPFSKIHVQLLSLTPLLPIVLPAGKTDFLWGRWIANDILKSETKEYTPFFFFFLTWRTFYFYGFHLSWKARCLAFLFLPLALGRQSVDGTKEALRLSAASRAH